VATSVRSSNKSFTALLVIVAVVGVAVLGSVVSRPAKVLKLDPAAAAGLAAAGIVIGSPDAPIEVTEFADFECPACGYFATLQEPYIRERLVQTGQIRFRFLDFPLDIHQNAVAAHNAAHCADEQGKFWEMHDAIYANQERWNGQATGDPRKVLREIAKTAGVDDAKWVDCYDSGRMLPQISANRAAGERLQVRSTPSFQIGDQLMPGALTYDQMKAAVDSLTARRAAAAPTTR
jgi:protein-disulfide isomerase